MYPDRNDFGPRFGFAYSTPWIRDFVLRGGYGMYYTPEITNSWTTLTLNPPIVQTFAFTGNATNPIRVESAFGAPGETRLGLFGSGALDPQSTDLVYAAMEPYGSEAAAQGYVFRRRLCRIEGNATDGNLRWQPAHSDRHAGTGRAARSQLAGHFRDSTRSV